MRIQTFDTTLRDGTQGEAVSFSVDDKLLIARNWTSSVLTTLKAAGPVPIPGIASSSRARETEAEHAKLTAFGSTRFAKNPLKETATCANWWMLALPSSPFSGKAGICTFVRALGISLEENLNLISETVALSECSRQRSDLRRRALLRWLHQQPRYALETLEAAKRGRGRALPVRYQRRYPDRVSLRSSPTCADVRRRNRHPPAQRFGPWRRQQPRRRSEGARTCRAA